MTGHSDIQGVAGALGMDEESIISLACEFDRIVKPCMKRQYLSHLVNAVEELIIQKRLSDAAPAIAKLPHTESNLRVARYFKQGNYRPYSIMLYPAEMSASLADVRFFQYGAAISYDKRHEDKDIRIAIAHELGHIFIREYLGQDDTEEAASTFAYIAMQDKDGFYKTQAKTYTFNSMTELLERVKCLHYHPYA